VPDTLKDPPETKFTFGEKSFTIVIKNKKS
jgi:hypothetical protein